MSMYFVWMWGCNKFEPKLILCGTNLVKIKDELKKVAECKKFTNLIDTKTKKGDDAGDPVKSIIHGKIQGPANDWNSHGRDYKLTQKAFDKLLDYYHSTGVRCRVCTFRLSIFKVSNLEMVDLDDLEDCVSDYIC